MTHPTKAVYAMLLQDFARVGSSENALFSNSDVEKSMSKIEVIDFHQTITVDGVQASPDRRTDSYMSKTSIRLPLMHHPVSHVSLLPWPKAQWQIAAGGAGITCSTAQP